MAIAKHEIIRSHKFVHSTPIEQQVRHIIMDDISPNESLRTEMTFSLPSALEIILCVNQLR